MTAGRAQEKASQREVLETIETHHGELFKWACQETLESTSLFIEIIKTLDAVAPRAVADALTERIKQESADIDALLAYLAARGTKPLASEDERIDAVKEVRKLLDPLIGAMFKQRERERESLDSLSQQLAKDLRKGDAS